jgi:flagellar basal-body rod protein FlgB
MSWLSERQVVTAANIANASTPGFRAREAEPFSSIYEAASPRLVVTSPGHQQPSAGMTDTNRHRMGEGWDQARSGNTVTIEKELMTASSTSRMMNLDISLIRSFHRMLLSSVKV